MGDKNLKFYVERLYELRDLMNIIYTRSKEKNLNTIKILREKFEKSIIKHNVKLLEDSINSKNFKRFKQENPNYLDTYVPLCKKYISILKLINDKKQKQTLIFHLRLEALKIRDEQRRLNQRYNVPDTPNTDNKILNNQIENDLNYKLQRNNSQNQIQNNNYQNQNLNRVVTINLKERGIRMNQ